MAEGADEAVVIRYNTVLNKSDVNLSYHEETWESFVSTLNEPSIRASKDGPAIVPARFRPGGKRKNSDGVAHTAVVLDLDNKSNTLSRNQIEQKLEGWTYAAHTTHSSTVEHPKWRVFLPLNRELTDEDYEKVYNFFYSIFGDAMDKSCSDIARLFFLPACKDANAYETWARKGRIFRIDDIYDDTPAQEFLPAERTRKKQVIQEARLFDYIPKGELHSSFMTIAGTLWAFGLPAVAIQRCLEAIPSEEPPTPDHIPHILREITKKERGNVNINVYDFNQEHAIITLNGDTKILHESIDPVLQTPKLTFFTQQSFMLAYAYRLDEAKNWILSKHARRYDGLIFDPATTKDSRYYNLWRGFSCESKPGSCELYLNHLRDNICDGDDDLYQWLLAWMASVVQKPATSCGTAVVLRGGQGTGKSLACKLFGQLFGSHFAQIANRNQLVGNFTGMLVDKIVVVAEEATFAGDRQVEGRLKSLVTEEMLIYEEKYMKAFAVRNCVHLMMCSNHEWVVPAGGDERRFALLDVGTKQQQNRPYFAAIISEYENGGKEALLHFLLHHKIPDGVDPGKIPSTEGLLEQKILSQPASIRFMLYHLANAQTDVPYSRHEIYEEFQKYTRNNFMTPHDFWHQFSRILKKGDLFVVKKASVGSKWSTPGNDRPPLNIYPNIELVREQFVREVFRGHTWAEVMSVYHLFPTEDLLTETPHKDKPF